MGEDPKQPLGAFRFAPIGTVPPHVARQPNLNKGAVTPDDIVNFYLNLGINPRLLNHLNSFNPESVK